MDRHKTFVDTGPRMRRRSARLLSSFFFSVMLAMLASLALGKSTFAALPPAGTTIGNQASATYTDFDGNDRTATSNTVITTVTQVGGLDLQADRTKQAAPGGNVYFPHTVTNTGNGPESYNLTVDNPSGDFNLTQLVIYADENGDGVPDNTTPITVTPELVAGASYSFVVAAVVPTTATAGQEGEVTVTATSTDLSLYDPATEGTKTNTDTAIISNNAIIDVTKNIDVNKGSSNPATTHRYTLTYINNGIGAARDLRIEDTLNADLEYVTGSGIWSQKAGALDEQNFGDQPQAGNGAATILYNYDDASGQVTAIISNVAPGETGTISFQVTVRENAPPQVIPNNAIYEYINNNTATEANITGQSTNTVNLIIDPTAGVTGTSEPGDPDPDEPDTHTPVPQGSTLYFFNRFTNTGTGTDTFDVTVDNSTYPVGTTFKLYKPNASDDGPSSPLTDTNGNGIPDTGPVESGATYNVVLQVILPPNAAGNNNDNGFSVDKTATSITDPEITTTVPDKLKEITPSEVELGNNADEETWDGTSGPVTTLSGKPGEVLVFDLSVRNLSAASDNYDLLASGANQFEPVVALPSGVSVVFRTLPATAEGAPAGSVITNTGNLASGQVKHFYAYVTIPPHTAPATAQDIYFQVKSPNTGALDVKRDAITIEQVDAISIDPNHTGQTYPGNSITYAHTVTNEGSAPDEITLELSGDLDGFQTLIYEDTNGNGILDLGEQEITDPIQLGAYGSGTDNKDIIVKVFTPANATPGMINVTTITATSGNDGTVTDFATDTTTIVTGQVTLIKEQAADIDLNSIVDQGSAYLANNLDLKPGEGILYKITVTNNSTQPISDLVVNDTIPQYTTYFAANGGTYNNGAAGFTADGTIFYPPTTVLSNGNTGVLVFDIGSSAVGDLQPGQTVTIYFGVKINE